MRYPRFRRDASQVARANAARVSMGRARAAHPQPARRTLRIASEKAGSNSNSVDQSCVIPTVPFRVHQVSHVSLHRMLHGFRVIAHDMPRVCTCS